MTVNGPDGEHAVAIARLEARLEGIKTQIDHQDRNGNQLVRLFEERIAARFDSIDKRLDMTEKAREQSRDDILRRLDTFETRYEDDRKEDNKRFNALERFNAKLIGAVAAASILTGGSFAAVFKALGG